MNARVPTGALHAGLDERSAQEVAPLWWPMARLGEGLEALARLSGLGRAAAQPLGSPPLGLPLDDGDPTAEARRWVEWAGTQLGLEVVPVDTSVPDLARLLRGAAPVVLPFEDERGQGFFLLLGCARGRARLLGPDLRPQRVGLDALRNAMCWPREAPHFPEISRLLEAARVPPKRRDKVRAAMLRERLASERIGPCWMLRLPASTGFWQQLSEARLLHRAAAALAVFAGLYALEIAGWGLIGHAALAGRLDFGWLAAWLLLLASMIPLRLAGGWLQSTFALGAGRVLKSRLLAGALRLDIEQVRQLGVGHLLGRVIESQALESLVFNGGFAVLVALIELAFAAWVLTLGAAPLPQLAALAAWCVLTGWLSWRYVGRLRRWTMARLDLTHELVERMVGHRTRLAQERPRRRDEHEDQALQAYLQVSREMDTAAVPAFAGAPSLWLLLALAALAPAFTASTTAGTTVAAGTLAISLGGMLLAQRAFGSLAGGLAGLGRAAIAWQQVAELFHAGAGDEAAPARPFLPMNRMPRPGSGVPLVDARGLRFRYRREGTAVLDGADLAIQPGERILLEGASGGGKSTLASLLVGLRTPQAGLLLLGGLDRHTTGDDWHRLATEAPQFHENHILSGSLAFNLLLGREWPGPAADLREAEQLCRELGLGDLLDRMPGGLMQLVGETGWQLSHGERSRVFLARALLQRAPLTVMDESFAALDPETLALCLRCVQQRAQTLVVIAHP